MNFNYTGLFIAVLILLGMLITCHLRNYFNTPKSDFINVVLPTGTPPLQYNKISYTPGIQKIPCEIAEQGNFPCSQIQTCISPQTTQAFHLSDSELAILYKEAYEKAGLEVIKRVLQNKNI
jgi:hypothetical protein